MRAATILLCIAWTTLTSTGWAQPWLAFLRAGEVKPEGWIRQQMQLDLRQRLTGNYHKVSNAVNLRVFERQNRPAGGFVDIPGEKRQKSWWSGEHEGYWKDSIVRMAYLVDDETQKQRATGWIEAMLAYHEFTGHRVVLRAVTKAVRLTLGKYRDTTYFGAGNGGGGL